MKTRWVLSVLLIFSVLPLLGQTPQAFKYQAIVRDANGDVIANRVVSLRISIIKDDPLGVPIYAETHQVATNEFGLVTIEIGNGEVVTGDFATMDWSVGTFYLKTDLDIAGQENYSFIGTTQILSVPFALFSTKSLVAENASNDFDKDSLNEIQNITKNGNTISLSLNGGSVTDNDIQQLQIGNNQLSITNGNTVTLDTDPDNELQLIVKDGNTVTLSQNGGSFTDSDNQVLSLQGNQLTISNGNSLVLSGAVDLDSDPTNELQNLQLNGDTIAITQGNKITLPHDNDGDPTNEFQNLTLNGNALSISNGNTVQFPNDLDLSPTNELQYLSYNNDTLRLTSGNYAVLPFSKIIPTGTGFFGQSETPPEGYNTVTMMSVPDVVSQKDINLDTLCTYNIGCNPSPGTIVDLDSYFTDTCIYFSTIISYSGCPHKTNIWKYNILLKQWHLLFSQEGISYNSTTFYNQVLYIFGNNGNDSFKLTKINLLNGSSQISIIPLSNYTPGYFNLFNIEGSILYNDKIILLTYVGNDYYIFSFNPIDNGLSEKWFGGLNSITQVFLLNDKIYIYNNPNIVPFNCLTNTLEGSINVPFYSYTVYTHKNILTYNNKAFFFGFQEGQYGDYKNIYIYDFVNNLWTISDAKLPIENPYVYAFLNNINEYQFIFSFSMGGGLPVRTYNFVPSKNFYMYIKQ